MEYITAKEAAQRWEISVRLIQQYCTDGRIPGARKFSGAWAIPADAQKPVDPRKTAARTASESAIPTPSPMPPPSAQPQTMMPLMNTPFQPGHCLEQIHAMPEGTQKQIALAEYHYFSGHAEEAAREAELFLTCQEMPARLSACLIYAYANLTIGQIPQARYALSELRQTLNAGESTPPPLRAAEAFVAAAAAVLLHLPLPEGLPPTEAFLPLLPEGLRMFALYVQAHYTYLQGESQKSIGMVEATLAMQTAVYPIPAIYLHLVAVMDYMSLRQPEQAQRHLLDAWALAQPDDLIEGFGEHHGLLGGMLEAVIKPGWPGDFRRIIDITYRFSAGWRKVHNPITGHDVADDLTTTEFAIAMLVARGWTNQKIAEHLHISGNTVKSHLSEVMRKLHAENRKDLKQYMLQ